MPLPAPNTPWPPRQLKAITPALTIWSAWYSGDLDSLSAVYGGSIDLSVGNAQNFFDIQTAANRGGVVGTIQRWFWGQRPSPGQRRSKMHVPIAADLCQASSDLLFADPPTITSADTPTQDRLAELVGDGMLTTLAEAAEVAAALGGVFLRATWDETINPEGPFTTVVHADAAIPTFRWGRLVEVTFWHVVADDGSTVLRHLEHHSLDSTGVGIITHALYEGQRDNLGHPVPLSQAPETASLVEFIDANSTISTKSLGLAVTYIPNQRPQRKWRNDPVGSSLGRSDLDGVETLMDALDETYTSWMRDIRLGKARLVVPREILEPLTGAGKGALLDMDREVFTPVATAAGSLNPNGKTGTAGGFIEQVQFDIRWQEHQSTAQQFVADILRTAGYSTQTFGEGKETKTATEVESRERRSLLTRDRKIRVWRPGVAEHVEKLLAIDAALFNGPAKGESEVTVAFPDGVQETQLALAQTAQAFSGAKAMSTRQLVTMIHGDWSEEQVDDEVELILNETGMNVPDPATFTGVPAKPDDGSTAAGA